MHVAIIDFQGFFRGHDAEHLGFGIRHLPEPVESDPDPSDDAVVCTDSDGIHPVQCPYPEATLATQKPWPNRVCSGPDHSGFFPRGPDPANASTGGKPELGNG